MILETKHSGKNDEVRNKTFRNKTMKLPSVRYKYGLAVKHVKALQKRII